MLHADNAKSEYYRVFFVFFFFTKSWRGLYNACCNHTCMNHFSGLRRGHRGYALFRTPKVTKNFCGKAAADVLPSSSSVAYRVLDMIHVYTKKFSIWKFI